MKRSTKPRRRIVSLYSEAKNDLALTDEDALNVIGGSKKKAKAHKAVSHARVVRSIVVMGAPSTPVTTGGDEGDDCEDPAYASNDSESDA